MTKPKLILVTGLPGSGKTTFALALAQSLGAYHLNSDIVRHSIGRRGDYSKQAKAAVYNEMLRRTQELLEYGATVIVDATFYKEVLRIPYQNLARLFKIPVQWIELQADEQTICQRVSQKREYSEADFEVYQFIKKRYEPLKEQHLVLTSDTMETEEQVVRASQYLALNQPMASHG